MLVAVSELRKGLRNYRLQVEQGNVVSAEYYGEVIAYLIPLDIAETLNYPLDKTLTLTLKQFRDSLSESMHQLIRDKDLIWLQYHERKAIAFVSAREYNPDQRASDQ